ncbi:MAG TPA: ABC transporter substrate-binding protein, partial [Candidatus Acidoferrales bacterium]|nr:ABC transporter substrate-binding protein [Candidatus Acidoferrales bacterium]
MPGNAASKCLLNVALTILMVIVVAPAQAQNKIRAAYSSISGIFTPVWIATDERLYQKNQIDADLVYIGGSPVAVSALIAGEIDFIYGGADPIIGGILGGADLTLAGFISNTTPISLWVGAGFNKVEDLKGKTVAVTRLASSTAYMAKVCFGQSRLEAMKDIPLIQSGGYPESLAALQAGRVQGAMLSPPFTYRAEALGFKRIWNGSGVEYPSFVLATRRTFIRDSADRAQRAFNAVAEGVHIFRTDKERAMRVMAKYTKVKDRTILENTYADNKDVYSPTMRPTASGVKPILDILAASNPKAAGAKPEQFIDATLSRRLEESGAMKKF